MAIASKLLGILLAGETVASTTALFMRLLTAVAAVAVLTAIAGMLAALMMGGLLWLLYIQLMAHGVSETIAVCILIGAVVMLLAVIIAIAQHHFYKIGKFTRQVMVTQSPISGHVMSVADAFLDGFLDAKETPVH